jgi:hypothetical protein
VLKAGRCRRHAALPRQGRDDPGHHTGRYLRPPRYIVRGGLELKLGAPSDGRDPICSIPMWSTLVIRPLVSGSASTRLPAPGASRDRTASCCRTARPARGHRGAAQKHRLAGAMTMIAQGEVKTSVCPIIVSIPRRQCHRTPTQDANTSPASNGSPFPLPGCRPGRGLVLGNPGVLGRGRPRHRVPHPPGIAAHERT